MSFARNLTSVHDLTPARDLTPCPLHVAFVQFN